ncbi:hypothetical protein BKA66DRAFT_438026 [Pyrenochaeta sp. MPI-SDFR-AT-0127]|nr:hypothetical protein BKA66DRAFT_438026 [Pyrenochaeta sp. MPI-SDFR-AT-0127]
MSFIVKDGSIIPDGRVICMVNVHYDVTEDEVKVLFRGLTILDQFRTFHRKTNRMSVVYVLFASVLEKNTALGLSGHYMRGRKVGIVASLYGDYCLNSDRSGFVRPNDAPSTGTVERSDLRDIPHNIDRSIASREDRWNLPGNKQTPVVTLNEWNNFQSNQQRRLVSNLEKGNTNVRRINQEGGWIEWN